MTARPFRPFAIRTADGREFKVASPEMAWTTSGGRVVFVATSEHSAAAIDLLLVTAVEPVGLDPGRSGQEPSGMESPA
jgi:hypothetical protein